MGQTLNMAISENNEEPQKPLSMHPKKFALWLFIVTIIMLFAAFTSAYIVRKGDGNWLEVTLPSALWFNSAIILLSSITMHLAYLSARKNNLVRVELFLTITTLLGVAFLAGQVVAWKDLVEMNVFFGGATSNPAGSFIYVLTGVHGFHLISGIVFLLIVLFAAFRYKVHSKDMILIEMCATYWHFLDFLWIYLFVFLLINN
jgi:cytochrome c oxidase subunit 3